MLHLPMAPHGRTRGAPAAQKDPPGTPKARGAWGGATGKHSSGAPPPESGELQAQQGTGAGGRARGVHVHCC